MIVNKLIPKNAPYELAIQWMGLSDQVKLLSAMGFAPIVYGETVTMAIFSQTSEADTKVSASYGDWIILQQGIVKVIDDNSAHQQYEING